MLFLVNATPKVGQDGPPSKDFVSLVVKEWETVLNLIKQGKIVQSYGFEKRPGGFSIWSVNSEEQLQANLKKLPLHPFVNFEIIEIKSAEKALEASKLWLKSFD